MTKLDLIKIYFALNTIFGKRCANKLINKILSLIQD